MLIKIGDKWYNGADVPIMVVLHDEDKENIKNMAADNNKYCQHPEDWSATEVKKWAYEGHDKAMLKAKED